MFFSSECTASCSPDRRTRSLHSSLLANDGAVRRVLAVLLHQSSFSPSTAAAAHKLDMQVLHMLDSSFRVLLCVSFSEIKKEKKIDMYFGQIIFCLLFVCLLTSCCCCWGKKEPVMHFPGVLTRCTNQLLLTFWDVRVETPIPAPPSPKSDPPVLTKYGKETSASVQYELPKSYKKMSKYEMHFFGTCCSVRECK